MPTATPTNAIRIRHPFYGPGFFQHLLPEAGHARALFDIDDGVERRVLVRDLVPMPAGMPASVDAGAKVPA